MNKWTIGEKKLAFIQAASADVQRQVHLFDQTTFNFWSRKTWVKFLYVYADNEFNKRHKRVGKIASFRIGTRNLDLIPSQDKPSGRGRGAVTRYYDVSRAGCSVLDGISSGGLRGTVSDNSAQPGQWRSFDPNTFSIMIQIWSFDQQKWVDRLGDFVSKDQAAG